jgi:hypothetical protein
MPELKETLHPLGPDHFGAGQRSIIALLKPDSWDKGAGLGASHQTGWTGLLASLIEIFDRVDGTHALELGRAAMFATHQPKK